MRQMMLVKLVTGILLFSFIEFAEAGLITSSSDPALAGSLLIDFDGAPTQNGPSFTFGDVTFSTTNGLLRIAPFGEGGSAWNGSGQTLTTRFGGSPSSFSISFNTPVSAFGMNWGAANPTWNVSLYDSGNTLLETVTFLGGDTGATFREFYGAKNSGIARVDLITANGGYDWVIIDDFQFVLQSNTAIPEPSTFIVFATGLAGLIVAGMRAKPTNRDK